MNRILTYSIIIGFCFFISYISVNGTNQIANRSVVEAISYKIPNDWNVTKSEKQFRLLEITLDTEEDFSLVLFSNIQGTADQNVERWIGQFKKDESLADNIIVQKDSLDNKYITLLEMYGTYEVPNMANPSQEKVIKNDYGLLGGVIEFPNSLYFVKAVGKNSVISDNSTNFRDFIYSIKLN
ncbi:MAG: hypothetical protein VYA20_01495 [Candidatus Neomarinimicrobiota bacterium]|nr:hypothetical protein [Candidatus Neomarinimicrobiota bacterium]